MNTVPRTRGRPFAKLHEHDETRVADRLLAVAEEIIEQKGHFNVTDREIAKGAGVTVGMINYYFGCKDGLLFAILDKFLCDIYSQLKEAELTATGDSSKRVFEIFIRAYSSRPAVISIMIFELAKPQSFVRDNFMKRHGHSIPMRRIFEKFVQLGFYSNKVDAGYAAIAFFSMLTMPPMLASLTKHFHPRMEDLSNEGWIDFVSRLFDRLFDAPST